MKHLRLLIPLLCVFCIGTIVISYDYYAPPRMRHPYHISQHHDDTIRIAYIGDSWVAMHKDYDNMMERMVAKRLHTPVKVQSYGICGLTSKEIYTHLFENPKMKSFIQQGFDICFISAGINDTYKKMSATYYKTSMDGIIQFMLANKIHPIILEIPDYDIQKAYDRQTYTKKLLRQVSMTITRTSMDCKEQFRHVLHELITEKDYEYKVSIIPYKSWNGNYTIHQRLLYLNDGLHLNANGYKRLDTTIVSLLTDVFCRQSSCGTPW